MSSWIHSIQELIESKKWRAVLSAGETIPLDEKARVLWAWPTESNIIFLRNILMDFKTCAILSVGCGSGLLEWILQETTGIPTSGIELKNSWWTTKYCPKPFINLNFVTPPVTPKFLQECVGRNDWQFTLLFCYFNNQEAFQEYLEAYKGSSLIIIGADEGSGRHTSPTPFELSKADNSIWSLQHYSEIGTTEDYIAVYTRKIIM